MCNLYTRVHVFNKRNQGKSASSIPPLKYNIYQKRKKRQKFVIELFPLPEI